MFFIFYFIAYFQCKQWGFLLKKLFGIHLGTGDYEHLTIDHSAMLLHQFHSLYHYSGQSFESSHKLHHQLFSRATNHDASGAGQSGKSINYKKSHKNHPSEIHIWDNSPNREAAKNLLKGANFINLLVMLMKSALKKYTKTLYIFPISTFPSLRWYHTKRTTKLHWISQI